MLYRRLAGGLKADERRTIHLQANMFADGTDAAESDEGINSVCRTSRLYIGSYSWTTWPFDVNRGQLGV